MVALAFSCDWLFFHAVSAMECMTKKASALPSDLNRNRVNASFQRLLLVGLTSSDRLYVAPADRVKITRCYLFLPQFLANKKPRAS